MIAPAFISQIQQRFSHEKRARVCVWFDPQEEFRRLLPIFQAQLAKSEPPTFHLLAYDPKAKHGQLWLKHQVWLTSKATTDAKFVLYLPFPEERWHGADERGKHHLELLTEYRITGTDWKVGGKRPTLFSFLKAAGAALPTDQTEQRKLTEGGPDSLLAKFAAKFAGKPAIFWEEALSTELAQGRLVGDVSQKLLDLAVEPEAEWAALRDKGVLEAFLAAVAEQLGDTPRTDNPILWVNSLVERLALTEAFVGYGEASDFPFGERLPPARYREAHVALLRRWLRDANCRPAWDRWIAAVEQHINLTAWAKGKAGAAYGFPHLVSLRWQDTVKSFVTAAAAKPDAFTGYVAEEASSLQREAEYTRAGGLPECDWEHLLDVTRFFEACRKLQELVPGAASTGECVRLFTDFAEAVDGQHLQLKAQAAELNLTEIDQFLDRIYGLTTNALNQHFFALYTAADSSDIPGLPFVTSHLDTHLWSTTGKRAVVIVDALRYDVAHQVKAMLTGFQITIQPLRAMLPTRTPVGMSALLPAKFTPTELKTTGNELHPIFRGKDLAVRENRLALLKEFGAETREIAEVENAKKPSKLSALLVVFGHEEVDSMGHNDGATLIRHVQTELERLARLVRKLHQWGYPEVHLITDHGFVLLDEEFLPPPVPINKNWCLAAKERFAIVSATADLPLKTKPFAWDACVRVALPPGLAYFKTEKSFSHGGAALQEMVIPHLISRRQSKQQKLGVEILIAGAGLNLTTAAVKIVVQPLAIGEEGEMAAMVVLPRNLEVDVVRIVGGASTSILPRGEAKRIILKPGTSVPLTLFFDSKFTFKQGDMLRLEIRDSDTGEQFPGPEGITLHVARDL